MEEATACVDLIADLDQCIDQFSRLEHRQIPALLQVQGTQVFQIGGHIFKECRGFLTKHRKERQQISSGATPLFPTYG